MVLWAADQTKHWFSFILLIVLRSEPKEVADMRDVDADPRPREESEEKELNGDHQSKEEDAAPKEVR